MGSEKSSIGILASLFSLTVSPPGLFFQLLVFDFLAHTSPLLIFTFLFRAIASVHLPELLCRIFRAGFLHPRLTSLQAPLDPLAGSAVQTASPQSFLMGSVSKPLKSYYQSRALSTCRMIDLRSRSRLFSIFLFTFYDRHLPCERFS